MINRIGGEFSKEEAFDLLIDLKSAAASEDHKNAPHFKAVYNALKGRLATPNDQFKKYLAALIGDKEQEKVLDIMAKVDKSLKLGRDIQVMSARDPSDRAPSPSRRQFNKPTQRAIRCYYCDRPGHIQSRCYQRMREQGEPTQNKRQRKE